MEHFVPGGIFQTFPAFLSVKTRVSSGAIRGIRELTPPLSRNPSLIQAPRYGNCSSLTMGVEMLGSGMAIRSSWRSLWSVSGWERRWKRIIDRAQLVVSVPAWRSTRPSLARREGVFSWGGSLESRISEKIVWWVEDHVDFSFWSWMTSICLAIPW